jgi:hypothetical protein
MPSERTWLTHHEPMSIWICHSGSRHATREHASGPNHPGPWRATTLLLACVIVMPATAATNSSAISVSATVVAACTIVPQLPSHLAATGAATSRAACAPAPALSTIAAPQPVVTVIQDAAGRSILRIEF